MPLRRRAAARGLPRQPDGARAAAHLARSGKLERHVPTIRARARARACGLLLRRSGGQCHVRRRVRTRSVRHGLRTRNRLVRDAVAGRSAHSRRRALSQRAAVHGGRDAVWRLHRGRALFGATALGPATGRHRPAHQCVLLGQRVRQPLPLFWVHAARVACAVGRGGSRWGVASHL